MNCTSETRIGVCSWSLAPESPDDLADALDRMGVSACQLALVPLLEQAGAWADAAESLRSRGIETLSGMLATIGEDYSTLETIRDTGGIAPDEHWPANRERAERVADVAAAASIGLVTFHAGFLPHDRRDPRREVLLDRLREIAALYAERQVDLAFETGQETAATLLEVLADLGAPNVGVNFDPANMILYGMGEPVAALRDLLPFVKQVHIKDAIPTETPGTWGAEVRAGDGAVDWSAFFAVLASLERPVDLIIEREAGASRERDIKAAVDLIRKHTALKPHGTTA